MCASVLEIPLPPAILGSWRTGIRGETQWQKECVKTCGIYICWGENLSGESSLISFAFPRWAKSHKTLLAKNTVRNF